MILKDYPQSELKGITPLQASQMFQQHVLELNRDEPDFVAAWSKARGLLPRLFAHAFPGAPAQSDGAALNNTGSPPAGFQLYLRRMSLPASTTREEFNIAWRANGSKAVPVDKEAIRDMLVGFYISAKQMIDTEARKAVEEKFPLLFAGANNEKALTNDLPAAGGDNDSEILSVIGHLCSAGASDEGTHQAAAFAHGQAAAAQTDPDLRQVHEELASFHDKQVRK